MDVGSGNVDLFRIVLNMLIDYINNPNSDKYCKINKYNNP